MGKRTSIAKYLQPQERYVRAAHLERDFDDVSALRDYVVTNQAREILRRIIAGFAHGSKQRAWRLTGDYGSGKSSLALTLAHVLSREPAELPTKLRSFGTLKKSGMEKIRFLPVLLTGSREPLSYVLLQRVVARLAELSGKRRELKVLRNARELLASTVTDDFDTKVVAILEQTLAYLQQSGRAAGLVLIIDELGKFLEYAILHPDKHDVYFLQQLGELAARSDSCPLVVVGILHQGFSAYAARSSVTVQKEWEKVAGRYEEIVLRQELDQTVRLAAAALNVKVDALPSQVSKRAIRDLGNARKLGWYGPYIPEAGDDSALDAYPVHASAFPVLIRLFQRYGQNERSLFSFLLSGEPFGLQQFASVTTDTSAFYRIHDIYDYINANLGYRLLHEPGSRWSLLQSLVDSYVPKGGAEELLVLKTVAVLNLLDSQGLLATDEALMQAVAGTQRAARARVKRALEILHEERRVLYDRGIAGGYCLWPYTSVDVVECYQRAERTLGPLEEIVPHARQYLQTRPVVARRHYVKTGNLRYFSVHYVPVAELSETLDELDDVSDGHVVVTLCENHEQRQQAIEFACGLGDSELGHVLLAVPPPLQPLASLFQDVRCWEWVRTNVPELSQDRFAEREVSRVLQESRLRAQATVNDLLGLRQGTASMDITWYREGEVQEVDSGSAFLSLLSDICEQVYVNAPRVHNELINRAQLSSAAAAARMRLIERIFEYPHEEYLGLDPETRPPEMSMYLSVLQHANLHRKDRKGEWGFALPAPTLDTCYVRLTLERITQVLKDAKEKRIPVLAIFEALREPPYGVRDGLIPLLLAIVCSIEEQHIALYEDGSFVRKISGEDFYRMLKYPDAFEMQYYKISGVRSVLFQQLLRVLDVDRDARDGINILDVVRPMFEFMGGLPQYTLRTRRLSSEAQAVRKTLLAAHEPAPLIFKELPEACGVDAFRVKNGKYDKKHVALFVRKLRSALDELRAIYPDLLSRIRKQIRGAFELDGSFTDVRERLGHRGECSSFVVREPRLKGFCKYLANSSLSEEPWLEALGSFACAKPPKNWYDADADRFADELAMLVDRFRKAENLSFGQHGEEEGEQLEEAVRVSLMQRDGTEVEQVVTVSAAELDEVDELESRIAELLEHEHKRISLAAVSRALWKVLSRDDNAKRGRRAAKRK